MEDLDFKPSVLLRDGIDLKELMTGLTTFETDTEFLHELELNNFDNEHSDEEPNYFANQDHKVRASESFDKLWSQMTPIGDGDFIRKSIVVASESPLLKNNATIKVRLSGFCEGVKDPFICTTDDKCMVLTIDSGGQLPGLDMALKSMRVGEYSCFLLSHKVMYGDLGCPPLIPAKATCLFYISVVGLPPAIDDRTDLNEENNTCFKIIYEKASALHITGKIFFQKQEYNYAIKSFKSAVNYLEFCRLKDEAEETKQQKFLGKLYLNLAICYNKANMPLKACSMCNTLLYMDRLWNNSKALFHNARALRMIGEYNQAGKKLKAAFNLDKKCPEIQKEFSILEEKKNKYERHEQNLTKNLNHAFRVYKTGYTDFTKPSQDFINAVEEFCSVFHDDADIVKAKLPSGLTKLESDEIKKITATHNLYCEEENDTITHVSKIKLN